MNKICFGCGVKLQFDKPEEKGYIPAAKYDNSVYCQRCFKLIHYGKSEVTETPKEINSIINSINADDKFVIFLVDFLSINLQIIKIFKRIKNKKLLVISKWDEMANNIKETKVRNYLKSNYEINTDIKFVSSSSSYGINSLLNYLDDRKINEVYIVGLSNSGKSTLINKILDVTGSKLNKTTTSHTANTTQDFIRMQVDQDLLIIDTPGFIIPKLNNDYKVNKTSVKPKIYQMHSNETIQIDNMYINYIDDTSITLYTEYDIKVNKYYKEVEFEQELDIAANTDLVIQGLGFISIKKKCTIKIKNIDASLIELRKSIFGEV